MQSKLIAACATGALALLLLPLAASAANPTPVSVTVTTGTTITAPAAVDIGSGFPGQTVTSADQDVSWWSNEYPLQLSVELDSALTNDQGTAPTGDDTTIARGDVEVSSADYPTWTPLNVAQPVADVVDITAATRETQDQSVFNLRVNIPSATEGTYRSTMTWTVQ
jgi:hypothetical protein